MSIPLGLFVTATWWLFGLGVVARIMWQRRPNGAWWICLPVFAFIWPVCWLTTR